MKPEDLYEAMQSVRPEYLEECEMYDRKRKLPRIFLLAAALSLCGIGTAAAVLSLRGAAKTDMGITTPLPEWREYEPAAAEVTLDSALCAGDQIDAYLRVSGVTPEENAGLMARDGSYHWDVDDLDYRHSCALTLEQISYEPDTQTALVRLHLGGVADVEQVTFWLSLYNGPKPSRSYKPVEIPITSSTPLTTPVDYPLPRNDSMGEMRITKADVFASYIQVTFTITPLRDITGRTGGLNRDELFVTYTDELSSRANDALSDASIQYRDGRSEAIGQLLSPGGDDGWYGGMGGGTDEELSARTCVTYRHITRQALDLREVVSITIGGTVYPLS